MPCNVLAIRNFHAWSWSCVWTLLKKYLQQQGPYIFEDVIKERTEKIHLAETKADIILVQNVDSLNLITDNTKAVVRIGGIAMQNGLTPSTCHMYDKILKQVGAIIGTNDALSSIGRRVNPNTFTIPNGIDLDLFCVPNRQKHTPFTVGFAGNISVTHYMQYKGYPQIVAACNDLVMDVVLKGTFYGRGQLLHMDMPSKFYAQIDCLVNASEGEGCSNTIMEALACGVPVIISRVGYHGEYLTDGVNCLFIERTSEDIRAKIKRLVNDPILWKTLSHNGRIFAEQYHDIRQLATEYDKVFRLCLRKNNKELL